MPRFKEYNRIEAAIEHKNKGDLLWAREYCQSRPSLVKMKEHRKHWNKLIKKVNSTLSDIENE